MFNAALLALAMLAQPASGFDWSVQENRTSMDRALRNFSAACHQFGFMPVSAADGMEKRLYAHLLLKGSYAADAEVARWAGFVREYNRLDDEDYINATAQAAGDALAAATLDPSVRDAAKARYVKALVDAVTPIFNSCRAAAADPFLSANYLGGTGSLDPIRRMGEEGWEENLPKVTE